MPDDFTRADDGTDSTAHPEPSPFEEVGRTGLIQFSGRIDEEFLPALRGDRARKVYREMMDNDPIVGGVLLAIDLLMRQVSWRVDPASDDPAAVEWAEFVQTCLADMSSSWADTLSNILTMLPFGWANLEIVYKMRRGEDETGDPKFRSRFNDGRIGWRKLDIRAQDTLDRWEFDEAGGLQGMVQRTLDLMASNEVFIPIHKSLLFRPMAYKNNPEGRSVLRTAYRPWFFKKRIEETEGIGIERDLAGLPVFWVPESMLSPKATADEKAAVSRYQQVVRRVRRNEQEGLVLGQRWDKDKNPQFKFELLSTGGARQFDTSKVISRYDQRIAMSMLADFILIGHEAVGSKALSVSKTDLFTVALSAYLDAIAAVFNSFAIPRLLRLNNCPPDLYPSLNHDDVQPIDLDKLGSLIERLSRAGMPLFPDGSLEAFIREQAGLPAEEGSEEVD